MRDADVGAADAAGLLELAVPRRRLRRSGDVDLARTRPRDGCRPDWATPVKARPRYQAADHWSDRQTPPGLPDRG
jgi:hypothetical protein